MKKYMSKGILVHRTDKVCPRCNAPLILICDSEHPEWPFFSCVGMFDVDGCDYSEYADPLDYPFLEV
jgi:hypothetical protein